MAVHKSINLISRIYFRILCNRVTGILFRQVYMWPLFDHGLLLLLQFSRDQITRVKNSDRVPFILLGNKSDLDDRRKVPRPNGEGKAKSWAVPYIETSAKTRENVDKAFFDLLRIIREGKQADKASGKATSGQATMPGGSSSSARGKLCCGFL